MLSTDLPGDGRVRLRASAAAPLLVHARDQAVLGAGLLHGALLAALLIATAVAPAPLLCAAAVVLVGGAMCWGSNTVSHIHLHAPLFSNPAANRAFSLYLSALLGVPQTWWKLRHLHHHGLLLVPPRPRDIGAIGAAELLAVAAPPIALALAAPAALFVLLPGWLFGLALCALQGHYEHVGGAFAVDHHGRLYNRLWFNDGFHAAHHHAPDTHWTALPAGPPAEAVSAFPPVLRWWEAVRAAANVAQAAAIDALERLSQRAPPLRALLLATHRRAWRALLAELPAGAVRNVLIVGGGLFPRTALLLAELLPDATLTILDADPGHLDRARRELDRCGLGARVRTLAAKHAPGATPRCDLLVIPLAYRGDRDALYRRPPASYVAIHDWIWRRRDARGRRVSWLLCKRLNLVAAARSADAASPPAAA